MANERKEVLFPVGRYVANNPYEREMKDDDGKPFLDASGKPYGFYKIGFAIDKGPETHWNQTPWGAALHAAGAEAYPRMHLAPTFSWKVTDGDSAIPNRKGHSPSENPNWKSKWVVFCSSVVAPKFCNADGSQELIEPNAIKRGYYVQVLASTVGNGTDVKPAQTPGIYINAMAIALAGIGEIIESTPQVDTTKAGFGKGPLPAGAQAVPPAVPGFAQPPATPAPAVSAPPPAATPAPAVSAPPPAATPAPVAPEPGFLQPPPPMPVGPTMAPGCPYAYEALKAASWSDEQMRAAGYLL